MVPLGRLNLLADKTRFVAAVGGVAFSVALILVVQALYLGYTRSIAVFIRDLPVDVWVGQRGAFDLFRSTTVVPLDVAQEVRSIDGVAGVGVLRGRQMSFSVEDRSIRSLVLAFETGDRSDEIAATLGLNRLPAQGEIAISDYVRRHSGLEPGDRLELARRDLLITAMLSVPSPPFGSFSVVNFAEAGELFQDPQSGSYVLVSASEPRLAAGIARQIERLIPDVSAYTRDEFTDSNGQTVREFQPVVRVLLVVSYLVGVTVASLTIYTATVEKTRDYGVLKAIGASNLQVYRVVLYQSLVVTLVGFALGLPLSIAVSVVAEGQVAEFITHFEWQSVLASFGAVVLMGLLSAFLPVRRVAGIEPAMVFRA